MIYKFLPQIGDAPQIIARIDDDGLCRLTCTEQDPAYLAWLAEGNTPLPADPPPPPDPKITGVEFEGVMCSATRDDQNGLVAVLVAHALQKENFQPTEFYFVNGNKLVLTAQNIEPFTAVWMPFRQSFFKPEPA